MATASYVVEIDINRNGAYDHANSDVTARVMALNWNNGLNDAYQSVAAPARGRVQLDNSDGAFNPEDSGAAYYGLLNRDMLVRIRTTAPEAQTLFIGKIAALRFNPGRFGPRTVDIDLRDLLLELQDAEYSPPLQQNVTTDEVIRAIFDRAAIALPYATDYWILGVAGNSELGVSTYLIDSSSSVTLDTGDTTLAYAGDTFNKTDGTSAMKVIKDMVTAEAGGSAKFFYNTRVGKFAFHRRLKNANVAAAATFTESDLVSVDYRYGDDICNEVEVSFTPREIGAPNSVLWSQSDSATRLDGFEEKTITARYFHPDNDNARIGGFDFIYPRRGADYTATANESGGADVSRFLSVSVQYNATDAVINLRNERSRTIYVQTLNLRGTPIVNYKKQSVTAANGQSIALYNRLAQSKNMDAVSDEEFAQNFADNYVSQFSLPQARIVSATIRANDSGALMTQALTRTVGDVITITLSDENHDANYEIVGERHTVTPGGEHRHEVVWTLRPIGRQAYWVLGVTGKSELGSTTILAF